ncbi:hypothetical protein [Pseudooctadecabacter sp.]|uniref:hypothetical protein n=1 Tax=Pseudooctadecabacter sp. TaxID=1966338 RepID=UPI0025D59A3B|nr:hypothetical protein [Pseudooctadecabacter sp.]
MTTQSGGNTTEQKSAAERIEEARRLHSSIRDTLKAVLDLVEQGELKEVASLPKQMTQLHQAYLDINKKEAEFNDKHGTGLRDGDIDFDAVRDQIRCRLGRIRKCCRPSDVSERSDES